MKWARPNEILVRASVRRTSRALRGTYGSPPQDFRDEPRDKAEQGEEHYNGSRADLGKESEERHQSKQGAPHVAPFWAGR